MDTTQALRRPAFTIGDRLRKARSLTDLDVRPFADEIGVSHGTITNYELENTPAEKMKSVVLRAWAARTGVDIEWLMHGDKARTSDYRAVVSSPHPEALPQSLGGRRNSRPPGRLGNTRPRGRA